MKTKNILAALAALGLVTAITTPGVRAAAPKKHHAPLKHRAYRHTARTRSQYVLGHTPSGGTDIVDTRPVARPRQVPATPVPQTPGASPATPPLAPGSSGDTRTPMTPPGVGGTGVPGGPGTQP